MSILFSISPVWLIIMLVYRVIYMVVDILRTIGIDEIIHTCAAASKNPPPSPLDLGGALDGNESTGIVVRIFL